MNYSEAYKGNYLEAADLMGKGEVAVTIEKVDEPNTIKCEDGRVIDKVVLHFRGAKKPWIVNKTNARTIMYMTGKARFADWVGETITLHLVPGFRPDIQSIGPTIRVKAQGRRRSGGMAGMVGAAGNGGAA